MIARARLQLAALAVLALAPSPGRAAEYTLAVIPQFEQRKLYDHWKPIAEELERRTGHRFRLVTTAGVEEFEAEFLKGTWDVVYMSPWFLAKAAATPGYVPLVRDRAPVSGILVVRKGGAFRKPGDLNRKLVAFPTPNSVGACMMMRAELKRDFGVEVDPAFVRSVSNVALHVAKGLAVAGGVPEKAWTLVDPAVREHLEVIHRTRPIPPHAIAAHPRVPAADREAIRNALLALATSDAGRERLAMIPMKEPVAASAEDYAAMERMGLDAWYVPGSGEGGLK